MRQRRDLGVHQRLRRDLSDGRGFDEGHEFVQVDDNIGRQDRCDRIRNSRMKRAWSMHKRLNRYFVVA